MTEMIFKKRNFELKLTENLTLNQFEPPQVPMKEPFTKRHESPMVLKSVSALALSRGERES